MPGKRCSTRSSRGVQSEKKRKTTQEDIKAPPIVSNWSDLVRLSNNNQRSTNADVKLIKRLRPEIKCVDSMVGMKDIKNQLCRHILFVTQASKFNFSLPPLRHVLITGPAGCGKTTFANMLARILNKIYGYRVNHIVHGTRANMIGSYVGHTAKNTQKVIDDAKKGVLIIDEAYSIGDSSKDERGSDTFAQSCVDTLNRNLTERADQFVCILIGYHQSINQSLFAKNEGMKRRFNTIFKFPPYSNAELFQLFCQECEKQGIHLDQSSECSKVLKRFHHILEFHAASVISLVEHVCRYFVQKFFGSPPENMSLELGPEILETMCTEYERNHHLKRRNDFSHMYV
jgi:SpoVK/Ycf46/Vps4 family AAA+-type ATPase